jgi:hypothetical protein
VTNPVDIDQLEALAKAATPGPWSHDDGNVFSFPLGQARHDAIRLKYSTTPPGDVPIPEETGFIFGGQENDNFDANAMFACAASPDRMLAIIAELRTLRAMKAAVHELAECALGRGNPLPSALDFDLREIERLTR